MIHLWYQATSNAKSTTEEFMIVVICNLFLTNVIPKNPNNLTNIIPASKIDLNERS